MKRGVLAPLLQGGHTTKAEPESRHQQCTNDGWPHVSSLSDDGDVSGSVVSRMQWPVLCRFARAAEIRYKRVGSDAAKGHRRTAMKGGSARGFTRPEFPHHPDVGEFIQETHHVRSITAPVGLVGIAIAPSTVSRAWNGTGGLARGQRQQAER